MAGQPGRSGRKSTRPTLAPALRALLGKKHESGETNRKVLADTLLSLALAGDIQAIKLIFERVDGKVPEPLEVSGPGGALIPLSAIIIEDAPRDDGN